MCHRNEREKPLPELALLTMKVGAEVIIQDISGQTNGTNENTLIYNPSGKALQGISHVSVWTKISQRDEQEDPVPFPATAALLLGGSALLGWARRRG